MSFIPGIVVHLQKFRTLNCCGTVWEIKIAGSHLACHLWRQNKSFDLIGLLEGLIMWPTQEHFVNFKVLCSQNTFIHLIFIILEINTGMENFQWKSRGLTYKMCTCITHKRVCPREGVLCHFNVVISEECSLSKPSD